MIELPNGYPTLEWSAKQLVMDNPALYVFYSRWIFRKDHFLPNAFWKKFALAKLGKNSQKNALMK